MNFESFLEKNLLQFTHHPEIKKILHYAVFPTGKLFRPHLGLKLCEDLKAQNSHNLFHWLAAIEIHHAYSLVHDDLPCMDNDDVRRGKPSTHKAFNEWKALLAGDALLIHSLESLLSIQHSKLLFLQKIFFRATGAKGLIQGQWMDLGLESQSHFNDLLRMHELKTGRLIELSLLGSWVLCSAKILSSDLKNIFRLGSAIGIIFQLLDDLDDLSSTNLNLHEAEINPFIRFSQLSFESLEKNLSLMQLNLSHYQLHQLGQYLKSFISLSMNRIDKNVGTLSLRVKGFDQLWNNFKSKNASV